MWRVVDIGGDGYYIHAHYSKMVVLKDKTVVTSVPFADIHSIICHGNSLTYSDGFLKECLENNIPLVLCDSKHRPSGMLLSMNGNNETASRIEVQTSASKPRKKQAWKKVVVAKLEAQRDVLSYLGEEAAASVLNELSKTVTSGDTTNREAVGAREYFGALTEWPFLRDDPEDTFNSYLDYTYTILRSSVARGISAAGLHPGFAIFHSNRINPYALADDLIEPLRPIADVWALNAYQDGGHVELVPSVKRKLTMIANAPVNYGGSIYTLTEAVSHYVLSYYGFLSGEVKDITFPKFADIKSIE